MDFILLKTQLLRAIRGKKSQTYLSRKLKFRGNQVFRWESNERAISWPNFVKLCKASDCDLPTALSKVFGYRGKPDDFAQLFSQLIGDIKISEVAETLKCSRFAVSRWVRGQSQPDLEYFLMLTHHYSFALFEFLELLVDVNEIPVVQKEYNKRKLQKEIHYRYPIVDAFLTCCELDEYKNATQGLSGFFSKKLGISIDEEDEIIRALRQAGIVQIKANGKIEMKSERLDLRGSEQGAQSIRQFWLNRALEHVKTKPMQNTNSSFGTIVLPSNREAAAKIKEEYYEFYHRVRAILQSNEGKKDRVQVFNFQLFDLNE